MTNIFVDRMTNVIKPEWQVLNSQPSGLPNQITYTNRGVKMRNDQFDILNDTYHFSLLLNVPVLASDGKSWSVEFVPGELAFGQMQFFLHNSLTDSIINTDAGPWGIVQHWTPSTSTSALYIQQGSSLPIEESKLDITDGDEPITFKLEALDNGRLLASVKSFQFGRRWKDLGESNQDTFGGATLYPCLHNVKSYSATDGANLWRQFRITEE